MSGSLGPYSLSRNTEKKLPPRATGVGSWGEGDSVSVRDRQVEDEKEVSCYTLCCTVLAAKAGLSVGMQALSSAYPGKGFEGARHPHP